MKSITLFLVLVTYLPSYLISESVVPSKKTSTDDDDEPYETEDYDEVENNPTGTVYFNIIFTVLL